MILAGVLLKMGTYGFLRFCIPMFPDVAVQVAPWFLALSVVARGLRSKIKSKIKIMIKKLGVGG